jgi:hypothetical protein
MNRALKTLLAVMTVAIASAAAGGMVRVAAQAPARAASDNSGRIPRTADGHPDLSGVWWRGSDIPVAPLPGSAAAAPPAANPAGVPLRASGARIPSFADLYQPWAREKAKTFSDKDDPTLRCIPVAFATLNASLLGLGFVGQIAQTPKFVFMLTESYHTFRIVPTDGRGHRDDVAPSLRGDAVGHWEGDTLVVDITNFNETAWMHAQGLVSFHSDALHIVERYRRVDAKTLEVDATVEDPKVLTGPWKVPTQRLVLAPFDQIMEVGCTGTETASLMERAALSDVTCGFRRKIAPSSLFACYSGIPSSATSWARSPLKAVSPAADPAPSSPRLWDGVPSTRRA